MNKKFFSLIFLLSIVQLTLCFGYVKPQSVSDEEWKNVVPYLMPMDHPIKKKLDRIFTHRRVTENHQNIIASGFLTAKPGVYSHAIITKHKKLKDYFFKFYSDEQQIDIESAQWVKRAFAARSVKKAIEELNFAKYFKVAKKWIYLIPENPVSSGPYPKHFILVATDLQLEEKKVSRRMWSTEATPKLLHAVWTLMEREGLIDSLVAHNLPFAKDGRLALVDLEHHGFWPLPYYKLTHYLNPEMQAYWLSLTEWK